MPYRIHKISLARKQPYSLLMCLWLIFQISSADATQFPSNIRLVVERSNQQTNFDLKTGTVMSRLLERLDVTVEMLECPWARCLKLLENGEADLIDNLYKTPSREKFLLYIEPPYATENTRFRFYTHKASDFNIRQFDDLFALKIGAVRGIAYFEQFDMNSELSKIAIINHSTLLNMLISQRVDAIIVEQALTPRMVQDFDQTGVLMLSQFEVKRLRGTYIAVAKKSPWSNHHAHLSRQLSEALKQDPK